MIYCRYCDLVIIIYPKIVLIFLLEWNQQTSVKNNWTITCTINTAKKANNCARIHAKNVEIIACFMIDVLVYILWFIRNCCTFKLNWNIETLHTCIHETITTTLFYAQTFKHAIISALLAYILAQLLLFFVVLIVHMITLTLDLLFHCPIVSVLWSNKKFKPLFWDTIAISIKYLQYTNII